MYPLTFLRVCRAGKGRDQRAHYETAEAIFLIHGLEEGTRPMPRVKSRSPGEASSADRNPRNCSGNLQRQSENDNLNLDRASLVFDGLLRRTPGVLVHSPLHFFENLFAPEPPSGGPNLALRWERLAGNRRRSKRG